MLIWKVKTREGYSLKILAELLQNNLKTACFEINNDGIKLCMMDHNASILIDLDLPAENFSVYKYKGENEEMKMFLGINLIHFHKMLKTIKKKDSIEFYIDSDSPTDLGIKVIPKENNRVTTSFIKIQNVQNLEIDVPEGYGKPIIVPSGEFQKMCKGLSNISSLTKIISKKFHIRFLSDAGEVMKRETKFGESEASDSEDDEDQYTEEYNDDFDTEQLVRITKLAGLSGTMQIFPKNDNPLLFRTTVGTLGKISVYLKSKKLQENESRTVASEECQDG
jgi:proliferating cell nuclear antigen PCNA